MGELRALARSALEAMSSSAQPVNGSSAYLAAVVSRGGASRSTRSLVRYAEDRAFVATLLDAVPATRHVAASILIERSNSITVMLDGVRVVAERDVARDRVNHARVLLELPALRPDVSPGFVYRSGGLAKETPTTRIYANVIPPDAWVMLGPVFEALAAAGIECDVKVLAHPSNYFRADSAVVYVPSDTEMRALRIVRTTLVDHSVRLDWPTPALTKRVARGIAVADEPSDLGAPGSLSHGEWVTSVLVQAVAGVEDVEVVARRIVELIRRDGRDPERPYRRGSGRRIQPTG